MAKHTWLPTKPQASPKSPIPDDLRSAVDARAAPLVADLKKRFCKKPKNSQFNLCEDIFVRWHLGSLYFVAVMRTPQGRPPTFGTHAARMEYAGDGKFNLAVPMHRGWNTFKRDIPLCFEPEDGRKAGR